MTTKRLKKWQRGSCGTAERPWSLWDSETERATQEARKKEMDTTSLTPGVLTYRQTAQQGGNYYVNYGYNNDDQEFYQDIERQQWKWTSESSKGYWQDFKTKLA